MRLLKISSFLLLSTLLLSTYVPPVHAKKISNYNKMLAEIKPYRLQKTREKNQSRNKWNQEEKARIAPYKKEFQEKYRKTRDNAQKSQLSAEFNRKRKEIKAEIKKLRKADVQAIDARFIAKVNEIRRKYGYPPK